MRDAKARRYHFISRWTVGPRRCGVRRHLRGRRLPRLVARGEGGPQGRRGSPLDADPLVPAVRPVIRARADGRRSAPGILEARLSGDLEGVIRWTIEPAADGCLITFDEDVDTTKATLNRLAPVVRPAYIANHFLMMAHGQAGLRTFLAGYALARREALPD